MMVRIFKLFVAPLFGLAVLLFVSACTTAPEMKHYTSAPEKPVGLTGTGDAVGLVNLAPHNMPGSISDYDLRARTIGLAPGGAIHNHPHAGRPGIVRVTKGTVIEYRGTTERTLKVGDAWYENADTVHWFRNPSSTEMAEVWVVDLVPKPKK